MLISCELLVLKNHTILDIHLRDKIICYSNKSLDRHDFWQLEIHHSGKIILIDCLMNQQWLNQNNVPKIGQSDIVDNRPNEKKLKRFLFREIWHFLYLGLLHLDDLRSYSNLFNSYFIIIGEVLIMSNLMKLQQSCLLLFSKHHTNILRQH